MGAATGFRIGPTSSDFIMQHCETVDWGAATGCAKHSALGRNCSHVFGYWRQPSATGFARRRDARLLLRVFTPVRIILTATWSVSAGIGTVPRLVPCVSAQLGVVQDAAIGEHNAI